MKKFLLILFLAVVTVQGYSQIKKCAVISVFGNRNLSDDPLDTKLYEKVLKDSSFNIAGTVNEFEALIMNEFVPQFPFAFKDKAEVINSEDYKALDSIVTYKTHIWEESSWDWANPLIPADGYINIAALGIVTDKRAIKKAFEIFPDIDAVLIAYVDFNLYDNVGIGGITSKKVYAYANIKVFNSEAKRIFKLKERESSKKGVTALGGFVLDPRKLTPMVFDAAEQLFAEMKKNMPKKLAKMAKKIDKMAGEDDN
ncbi:hypothetical protein [Fulvivirga lutea]|uniref:Uncharacterized protein n=1 Tax=Fulvivirga lutea TaxID=2810512 RepID=A0A974WG91_9BACT|nr:hypothetical protein [Fulvivirga lutea]QSE97918.1 hypothetical protein JR347_02185 [Fulvivirga lutea]